MKIYEFKNCDTCRKALKYLDAKKIAYEKIAIVNQPPTLTELKKMLGYIKEAGGTVKNLFNTSGVQYRELDVSTQIKEGMTEAEALQLLSKNGKLIKRPFLLTPTTGLVGFKKDVWDKALNYG